MKSDNKFANWIKNNYSALDIHINELSWIKSYFPTYHDATASVKINGIKIDGRGSSNRSIEHAIEKALTEAIERAAFLDCDMNNLNDGIDVNIDTNEQLTTSGIALHTSERAAIIGASLELIERDLFLCHYFTSSKIRIIEENTHVDCLYLDAQKALKPYNIEILIGELYLSKKIACYICAAFGDGASENKFGTIIGLGCTDDKVSAINKAILECVSNVHAHIVGGDTESLNEQDFSSLQHHEPVDHLRLAKDIVSGVLLRKLFTTQKIQHSEDVLDLKTITIKELYLPKWCSDCGLIAMRAYDPSLQKIFFGPTTKEKLNLKRLSHFARREISYNDINYFPHPLP